MFWVAPPTIPRKGPPTPGLLDQAVLAEQLEDRLLQLGPEVRRWGRRRSWRWGRRRSWRWRRIGWGRRRRRHDRLGDVGLGQAVAAAGVGPVDRHPIVSPAGGRLIGDAQRADRDLADLHAVRHVVDRDRRVELKGLGAGL